jgi:hypothetical protein
MALPRGDEYNQAVQNPRINFSDTDLKLCQVETNPLGLPKPYSGGFTTTYRLDYNSSCYAVRCFTREISDLQKRYQAIGIFYTLNRPPFLVDAYFLTNGIKVNGIFYPIIKMSWIKGDPLNHYLSKVLTQKPIIEKLLNDFKSIVNKLETYGIAHGDLQHGNIIVKNNSLFLIDYDGMFFPDLASLKVNELGHPNFQHPKRTTSDYNKYIDRFSSVIIYTALKALIYSPNLWKKYDNGDNILFTGKDYSNPQSSSLLKELSAIPEVSTLAQNISAICTWDFSKIPSLNDFLVGKYTPTISTFPPSSVRSAYLVIDGTQKGRLLEYIGQRVEVVGKITDKHVSLTKYGDPYLFLNIGSYPFQTFTIVLWSDALNSLRAIGIDPNNFVGKYISVIGVLGIYSSRPQMAIDQPNQIQILSGQSEINHRLRNSNIPTTSTTPQTQPIKIKKPEDIFEELYRDKTITTPTSSSSTSSYNPTTPTYPKSTNSHYSSSSSQKTKSNKYDTGCAIVIIAAIIGGILGAATSSEITGVIGGVFCGTIIGSAIKNIFT